VLGGPQQEQLLADQIVQGVFRPKLLTDILGRSALLDPGVVKLYGGSVIAWVRLLCFTLHHKTADNRQTRQVQTCNRIPQAHCYPSTSETATGHTCKHLEAGKKPR
jgi:hypothetical protein